MNSLHNFKEKHKNGSVGECTVNLMADPLTPLPYPELFARLLNAYQTRLNLIAEENSNCLSVQSFKHLVENSV